MQMEVQRVPCGSFRCPWCASDFQTSGPDEKRRCRRAMWVSFPGERGRYYVCPVYLGDGWEPIAQVTHLHVGGEGPLGDACHGQAALVLDRLLALAKEQGIELYPAEAA